MMTCTGICNKYRSLKFNSRITKYNDGKNDAIPARYTQNGKELDVLVVCIF